MGSWKPTEPTLTTPLCTNGEFFCKPLKIIFSIERWCMCVGKYQAEFRGGNKRILSKAIFKRIDKIICLSLSLNFFFMLRYIFDVCSIQKQGIEISISAIPMRQLWDIFYWISKQRINKKCWSKSEDAKCNSGLILFKVRNISISTHRKVASIKARY